MRVTLNGEPFEAATGTTLALLLDRLEMGGDRVAAAVNGEVVPRREHATRALREGDVIEVIHAVAGG